MLLNWQGNSGPITANSGGKLQTSHGPALIAADTLLQMIYVGESTLDDNLWTASTLATIFPKWDSNQQIDSTQTAPGSSVPLSSYRPALALFNGLVHMVYVGQGGANLWWAWAKPNGQWTNVQLPWSGAETAAPALAVHSDGKLYLAWHEYVSAVPAQVNSSGQIVAPATPEHNYIKYSSLATGEPLSVSSWAEEQLVGDGASIPTMASYLNTLYLFATPAQPAAVSSQILTTQFGPRGWVPFSPFQITGTNPLSSGGAAAAVFNNELYVVYPGEGGKNLWYAWIDGQRQTHGNVQIVIAKNNTPETSAPLGAIAFNGALCVAYKGESSDNVWMSFGKP
jgi:hypothetical protein